MSSFIASDWVHLLLVVTLKVRPENSIIPILWMRNLKLSDTESHSCSQGWSVVDYKPSPLNVELLLLHVAVSILIHKTQIYYPNVQYIWVSYPSQNWRENGEYLIKYFSLNLQKYVYILAQSIPLWHDIWQLSQKLILIKYYSMRSRCFDSYTLHTFVDILHF